MSKPDIITVPCFSGAPWNLKQLEPLSDFLLHTMRLPEGVDDIEAYADFVQQKVKRFDCYILVGDSFGAVISLVFATRAPHGLRALVLSGGFAANPVRNPFLKLRIKAAKLLPGPLYRAITLRMHASSLSSPHDAEGQVPWSKSESRKLFLENTPYKSYVSRANAVLDIDYRGKIFLIKVPTLIISPSYDRLIGKTASKEMLEGIPDATEIILERTGHMFRFSHPITYANAIRDFIIYRLIGDKKDINSICN
jgi:pimeloyl-ACP methyl ester carboxylesterase